MKDRKSQKIVIVGGGPVGSMLAIYLAKRGFHITLFEKRGDPRSSLQQEGKSINLALSARGLNALHEIGVDDRVCRHAVQMKGRYIHDKSSQCHFIPYSPIKSHVIYSISRMELNKILIEKTVEFPNITIQFDEVCEGLDEPKQKLIFRNSLSGVLHEERYDVLFDAQGMWSPIRTALLRTPYTNFSQEYLDFDYKELTIPNDSAKMPMRKDALHLWPRVSRLLIALPNHDGSFTCTLFLPHQGPCSFESLDSAEKIKSFFKEEFPDSMEWLDLFCEQMKNRAVGYLSTVKMTPWAFGRMLLIGDAAHGIVPFYGQGLNCGFEDCFVLNQMMEKCSGDWEIIFREYEKVRKIDTDAIAELSFDNFVELRELVADPVFRLKRKLEADLEAAYPGEFLSKYSMVTFSCIPYHEALVKGRKQDQVLMDVCSKVSSVDDIDLDAVKKRLSI